MSVRITVHCDRAHGPAVCPVRLYTEATTVEDALTQAARNRWTTSSGRNYCPTHSGRRGPTTT